MKAATVMIFRLITILSWMFVKLALSEVIHLSSGLFITEVNYSNNNGNCFRANQLSSPNATFEFCYPAIVVAGFPKCGTSFIFSVLAQHPWTIKTRRKELCLGGIKSESWAQFISYFASPTELGTYKLSLSGCLHLGALTEAAAALQIRKTKYIFTVRNAADMLWAAYNYWCIIGVDEICSPGQRTTLSSRRSPEHFHEMIINGKPMGGGIPLTPHGDCFMPFLKRAIEAFGHDNIIVIKVEDLSPLTTRGFRRQMLRKLLADLNLDHIDQNFENEFLASSILVNSGFKIKNRGEFAVTSTANITSNVYEVSGYSPILEKTKLFILAQWNSERLWLRETFSITY